MQKIDPRHQARKLAIFKLYSEFFRDGNEMPVEIVLEMPGLSQADLELLQKLIEGVKVHTSKIDAIIAKCAPDWPLDRISKLDLSILRLSVYELIDGKISSSIAIDEAVELAKEFGSENSSKFINGVLGSVAEKAENEKLTAQR